MKIRILLFVLLFMFLSACTEKMSIPAVDYIPVSDLSKYNMKILPELPVSGDIFKLVILNDCQYNLLNSVTRDGNTIEIEKHFNSMMKLPCLLQNDTIVLEKLTTGSYIVRYRLLDLSTLVKDPVSLAISFDLKVN